LLLKEANLHDFLHTQQGLDTPLAEQGSNLSGGQRQRLALARVLLTHGSIYIFDEATSNIDVESEEAIMTVVTRLAESKTVILVSHRLANVVDSPRVFVMESGKLVKAGPHQTLLDNGSLYHRLFQSQYNLGHQISQDAS
jgi:ATP-binding cassette subfamily C protein